MEIQTEFDLSKESKNFRTYSPEVLKKMEEYSKSLNKSVPIIWNGEDIEVGKLSEMRFEDRSIKLKGEITDETLKQMLTSQVSISIHKD